MGKIRHLVVFAIAMAITSCGGSGAGEDLKKEVVANYAELVYVSYQMSLESAIELDSAIGVFIANPTEMTLQDARAAWLAARGDYSPTEAFRFYGGPIDDEETGVEGLLNAWPLDEAYIDYVEGALDSGIVNMVDAYPDIDADLLIALNEDGGEANISTGWHAIEFLLWGQDLSADGPGDRSANDYSEDPNSERRAKYLMLTSDLLVDHLQQLVEAWEPDEDNYRAEFEALPRDVALARMITGIGELSRGELAGERLSVAYETRSQEDEHSCFSDNTTADIIGNASGIEIVYIGSLGSVDGPGLYDLVAVENQDLADRIRNDIASSVANAKAIPAPFDQLLAEGVSDDDPGRVAISDTITSLETQANSLVEAASVLGVETNLT